MDILCAPRDIWDWKCLVSCAAELTTLAALRVLYEGNSIEYPNPIFEPYGWLRLSELDFDRNAKSPLQRIGSCRCSQLIGSAHLGLFQEPEAETLKPSRPRNPNPGTPATYNLKPEAPGPKPPRASRTAGAPETDLPEARYLAIAPRHLCQPGLSTTKLKVKPPQGFREVCCDVKGGFRSLVGSFSKVISRTQVRAPNKEQYNVLNN